MEDSGRRSSKRRKVSLAKDMETSAPEVNSESADDAVTERQRGVYEARQMAEYSSV